MYNPGLRNPRRNMLICVAATLVAWAFVAWGAFEMHQAGEETFGSGLKIGLALLPVLLGPFMILNFRLGVKVFAAIRRGENEIGRWTVPPPSSPGSQPTTMPSMHVGVRT